MQYEQFEDGSRKAIAEPNPSDTGMGIERVRRCLQGHQRQLCYDPDGADLIEASRNASNQDPDGPGKTPTGVIADHLRSLPLIADGVMPFEWTDVAMCSGGSLRRAFASRGTSRSERPVDAPLVRNWCARMGGPTPELGQAHKSLITETLLLEEHPFSSKTL